jgi:hypothetical protein
MQIILHTETKELLDQLQEMGKDRQMPYALSLAVNRLGSRVQQNLQAMMLSDLNVRRPMFIKNSVRFEKADRSSYKDGKFTATVRLGVKATWLSDFETGGEHQPYMSYLGEKWLAKPNRAVFGNSIIGKDNPLNPNNLNLTQQHGTGLRGDQRSFLIVSKRGTPLILQRVASKMGSKSGRKKGVTSYASNSSTTGLRLLFTLIKHAHRPAKIQWYNTAYNTVEQEATGIFTDVIHQLIEESKRSPR